MATPYFRMTKQLRPEVLCERYWERPSIDHSAKGDVDVRSLYQAVGEALSSWENAEDTLAVMYRLLCKLDSDDSIIAVNRAFGSIESSAGRRRAILAAAEIFFGEHWDDSSKYFEALMDAFSRASSRRDEFAHGVVTIIGRMGESLGAYLLPSDYNTHRNNPYMADIEEWHIPIGRAKYFYTSSTIRAFTDKFCNLRLEVYRYMLQIKLVNGTPKFVLDALQSDGAAERN
jgi:hypothetical protein